LRILKSIAPLAIAACFALAVIAGFVSGTVAALLREPVSTCFVWGGAAFATIGTLSLAALAVYYMAGGGGTSPADSQRGASGS
jgi:hypothetical protein